jgi:hypothetical protein
MGSVAAPLFNMPKKKKVFIQDKNLYKPTKEQEQTAYRLSKADYHYYKIIDSGDNTGNLLIKKQLNNHILIIFKDGSCNDYISSLNQ